MHESEWVTRKNRIDYLLKNCCQSWKIVKYDSDINIETLDCVALEEYPTLNGRADYALFVRGKLLGFIEAKKLTVDPKNALEQAKRYSRAVKGVGNWNGLHVPFLYSSNGVDIWFLDIRGNNDIPRSLSAFHTPNCLLEWSEREETNALKWFSANPIEHYVEKFPRGSKRLYDYQMDAISATEQALLAGKREMLIAMATGTGKTFTMVSQIYRLLSSGFAKRVLFLVDRKALAAQAVTAFNAFDTPNNLKFDMEYELYSQRFRKDDLEEGQAYSSKIMPTKYLQNPGKEHTFIYVCTIQRMAMNLFTKDELGFGDFSIDFQEYVDDGSDGNVKIPIHAFDTIVADECHRGYTSKETNTWRKVIDYFDAVKIGLTATPAPHTTALFKEVVFRFGTTKAVEKGFLVDYDPVVIKSGVRINGVFLHQGDEVGFVDTKTGEKILDQLEEEREFDSSEIERKITVPDSNRKIIKEIAKYASEHEKLTGRFPKTLIFAANDLPHISHADQIVQICREVFGQGSDFVQKITGNPNVDKPLQKIREFRNRPNPKIVVTVDMLSTGVDVPSIEFVVFLRPIKSRILWIQMLGRGARTCKDIHKTHFVVFDCFGGTLLKYFNNATDFDFSNEIQGSALTIEQVIDNIYKGFQGDYYTGVLIRRLQRISKNMSGEAFELFTKFIPNGDIGQFASTLRISLKNDFSNTMKILRNKEFVDLLHNYPRNSAGFVIASGIDDEVTSERVFKNKGEEMNAFDYIEAFASFVRENKDEIEAVKILTQAPKHWSRNSLKELRSILKNNSFKEDDLQEAHKIVYKKPLVDIISMIRTALANEPVLSVEERVDRAIAKVTVNLDITNEQQIWLDKIRDHLIVNLALEPDDIDNLPAFERMGGSKKAQRIFGNRFNTILLGLNEAIAS